MSREEEEAKLLIRAQRMAKRTRALAACLPCKAKKSKCNDYRPCARCKDNVDLCIDGNPDITSNMYPAGMAQASRPSGRSVMTHDGRCFHFGVVVGGPESDHPDSFGNFGSYTNSCSESHSTSTPTRISQVYI